MFDSPLAAPLLSMESFMKFDFLGLSPFVVDILSMQKMETGGEINTSTSGSFLFSKIVVVFRKISDLAPKWFGFINNNLTNNIYNICNKEPQS